MNIGFEAKRFFTNRTGLGNYSRFIVDALSLSFPEDQYSLYTPSARPPRDAEHILARPCVKVVTPGYVYKLAKSLWRSWGVSQTNSVRQLQVFHGLSQELPISLPSRLKKVVTVHDLIFYRFPAFYNSFDVKIYKSKLAYACQKADKIIAVSQQTKEDLLTYLKVQEEKIVVINQGCHFSFNRTLPVKEITQINAKYKLPSQYVLNVGTIEKRKNIVVLIEAMQRIPKDSRLPIVVIGRQGSYFKEVLDTVKRAGLEREVIFLENVPFSDFPAVYQGAQLFVYPSLFEGFGIPLIEAITSKVPVITSTGSCFSEAAGPYAKYVDPKDPEKLSIEMSNVLSDDSLRLSMIAGSLKYIEKFQPAVIAKEVNHLYNSLIQGHA